MILVIMIDVRVVIKTR